MDIPAILTHNSLVELAAAAGADLRPAGNRRWRSHCPLHHGHNPSGFSIIEGRGGKQLWHCFSGDCGRGDLIDFVMHWRGLDFRAACQYLAGGASTWSPIPPKRPPVAPQQPAPTRQVPAWLAQSRIWETDHARLAGSAAWRQLWRGRGVPDLWQDIWCLGCRDRFPVREERPAAARPKFRFTPTLTIPIFRPDGEIVTIRHRLLDPPNPRDRYRPERAHLGSFPFLANPAAPPGSPVLVVEGEIKAMVAAITADNPALQVLGIPGKQQFARAAELLAQADPIYLLPDPDGLAAGLALARDLAGGRCRIIQLGLKVDDAILAGLINRQELRRLMQCAPRINFSTR